MSFKSVFTLHYWPVISGKQEVGRRWWISILNFPFADDTLGITHQIAPASAVGTLPQRSSGYLLGNTRASDYSPTRLLCDEREASRRKMAKEYNSRDQKEGDWYILSGAGEPKNGIPAQTIRRPEIPGKLDAHPAVLRASKRFA